MRKIVKKGIVWMIFTSIIVTSILPVTKVNAENTQVQENESIMDWNLVDTFLKPNLEISLDKKIPIAELEKQFPSEMEVILADGVKEVIPVTWICESDYEKEDYDSYVFEVALPEEYKMSDTCASAFVFVALNDDIKDGDETKITFNNTSDMTWELDEIVATPQQPQPLNTDGIQIEAKTLGETEGLQYKFVWMKNNWKQWGVLQNFSSDSKVEWKPKEVGKYTLYVDVKDIDGKVITKSIPYEVSEIIWQYEKIDFFPVESQKLGEKIQIKVNTSGNTKGLQYKFVWMKNDWEQWGVIQPFSEQCEVEFTPEESGTYRIYVDIKDWNGNVTTQYADYVVKTDIWRFDSLETDLISPQEKYTVPIEIRANTSGEISNLQYKFVWMKDNWKEWGVIQTFSKNTYANWYPKDVGQYWLYVDIKDVDGYVVTQKIPYIIQNVQWDFENIEVNPENVQKIGTNVEIIANTKGNTKGLQYKFVWMKDDWKEWGVIQNFSDKAKAIWNTPDKSGKYQIYVDIKDRDGKVITKSINYFLASQIWQHDGINVNNGEPQQIYRNIPVKANVSGDIDDLQYKFVWMKDDWKEWGVIQEFDTSNEAIWYPKEPGDYKIYSDVKDLDGRVITGIQEYTVLEASWKVDELHAEASGSFFVGDSTDISIMTSGYTEGLKYKFVQKYGNDWSDWKVLQDFDENSTVTVDIEKEGNYTIYVDIMDQEGYVFDPVTITVKGHVYKEAVASPERVTIGKSTILYPEISGDEKGMECKFVWMKNNWEEWGVLSDFSSKTSLEWTPPAEGRYYISIDVRLNNMVQTKIVSVDVVKEKNGWYYENGYKFYYKNDVKVEDVRNLIGTQSDYVIEVNKQMSCVTIFAKDGNNGYIIPVVAFACSPGSDTPTGTFYTQEQYRWHHLYGADGQFCTRITGHVLFHSPPYSSFNNHTLWPKEYNRLGTWASAGCVRLRSGDAKWIYDNCKRGTKVVIYNSSVAGPFSKPVYSKIPLTQTWDPTDPYA